METTKRSTALVTGASSGIGLELAKLFARDKHDLVLVARSGNKLDALAAEVSKEHGIHTTVISADLADPKAVDEVLRQLTAKEIAVDILVNNAGYGVYGAFAETDLEAELKMIQVNVVTLTALTKQLLPGMIARKSGRVLNVASTAAFQPGPLMAVYYATKAYVLSFSEALSNELIGTGVTVTALCPGPTTSGFQAGAKMEDSRLVKGRKIMDALTVAKAGYAALQRGQPVVIPGVMNKVLAGSIRLFPRQVVTKMVRAAQERVSA